MENKYIVSVSNIGIVHTGNNYRAACKAYAEHKKLIKQDYGSWACEMVCLIAHDFVDKEFYSKNYNWDI